MKPIYGRWSTIATIWVVQSTFCLAAGVFDVIAASIVWPLCFLMFALTAYGLLMLIRELRELKAGREREQASIATFEARIAELARRHGA